MRLTLSQWQNEDRRDGPRARVQLRVALVYPKRAGHPTPPVYHAKTHDICMSGLSMVVDENVFHEGEITVLLALPPEHSWAAQKIMTATAMMTYAIHSSKLDAFKIGMSFVNFKDNGKALLQKALEQELSKPAESGVRRRSTRSRTGRMRDSRPRGW
jgi:hypothetical protein